LISSRTLVFWCDLATEKAYYAYTDDTDPDSSDATWSEPIEFGTYTGLAMLSLPSEHILAVAEYAYQLYGFVSRDNGLTWDDRWPITDVSAAKDPTLVLRPNNDIILQVNELDVGSQETHTLTVVRLSIPFFAYISEILDTGGDVVSSSSSSSSTRPTPVINKGNIYITDTDNNRIQMFDNAFTYQGSFGTLGINNSQFNSPRGGGVDQNNNWLYVADTLNHRIQKFTLDGIFLAKWGSYNPNGVDGTFQNPSRLDVDEFGYVYVTDTNNSRIQKFNSSGNFVGTFGRWGVAKDQLDSPIGIAVAKLLISSSSSSASSSTSSSSSSHSSVSSSSSSSRSSSNSSRSSSSSSSSSSRSSSSTSSSSSSSSSSISSSSSSRSSSSSSRSSSSKSCSSSSSSCSSA